MGWVWICLQPARTVTVHQPRVQEESSRVSPCPGLHGRQAWAWLAHTGLTRVGQAGLDWATVIGATLARLSQMKWVYRNPVSVRSGGTSWAVLDQADLGRWGRTKPLQLSRALVSAIPGWLSWAALSCPRLTHAGLHLAQPSWAETRDRDPLRRTKPE